AFTEEAARLGLEGPALLPRPRVTIVQETDSTNSELLRLLDGGRLPETGIVQSAAGTHGLSPGVSPGSLPCPLPAGPLLNADGSRTERGQQLNLTLLAAASQSAGRGRIGRRFWSPDGSGIYFSFIYIPEGGIRDPGRITAAAAVGVCRAADSLYGIRSGIKWVNDVYVGGKKVSGILTEGWTAPFPATPQEHPPAARMGAILPPPVQAAVVGIGINIRTGGKLPPELSAKAGGLADEAERLGCPSDRAAAVTRSRLLAACMAHILRILPDGDRREEDIGQEYASRSILTGREVTVIPLIGSETRRYRARVTGIGSSLGLLVRTQDGRQQELTSGEVSLQLDRPE
ncbi:MAG: biotin--[Treponema sp.]|nr:biotin--[acetyl-CoA-carboxylase] ligase [Treponema sp.]